MGEIMTGTAITDIEMPVGMPMTGYFARQSNSTGFHDQLKVRSIVFDDGLCKILMVVCDLLGLDSAFIKETSVLIEAQTGIHACNIVIACIHTHSGPASIFLQDCGEVDEKWLQRLKTDILNCVKTAVGRLKLSTMEYSTGLCDIGINRVVNENENSKVLRDRQFGILKVKDACNGKIDTVIVNYACHPVVLGGENLLYSKDYPNYTEKYLKEKLGSEVNVIFVTGCCGDINPAERGDFTAAEKNGCILAESIIERSILSIKESDFRDINLEINSLNVEIPLSHDLNENSAYRLKENYLEESKKLIENGKIVEAGVNEAYAKWADSMYKRSKLNTLEKSVNADIKVIKIGKLVILTLPFEVFHEIGLKIKSLFGFENTIVICYANGDYGYVPSKALYSKASYEAGSAHKFYGHPGAVCMDTEDIILTAVKTCK